MDIDISLYFDRLSEVYDEIDREYDKAAKQYDTFSCDGCKDNCCKTVFYHYTLIENLYFIEGIGEIPENIREDIVRKATDYVENLGKHPFNAEELSIMCPVNVDGKCIVYKQRPLICRIHGLPGMLHSPLKGTQKFEGCLRFSTMHGDNIFHEIDRTAFYSKIAYIERDLRKEIVFTQKYKKTIAEMIIDQTKDEITLVKKMGPEDFHKDSHII